MAPAIAPDLFELTPSGAPVLVAGRNRADGRLVFPLPRGSEAELYEAVALPTTGALWSFTIQRFPPVSPPYGLDMTGGFEPFAIGYVDLDGALIVEARLLTERLEDLRIGAPAALELEALRLADGSEVTSFAFRIAAP